MPKADRDTDQDFPQEARESLKKGFLAFHRFWTGVDGSHREAALDEMIEHGRDFFKHMDKASKR